MEELAPIENGKSTRWVGDQFSSSRGLGEAQRQRHATSCDYGGAGDFSFNGIRSIGAGSYDVRRLQGLEFVGCVGHRGREGENTVPLTITVVITFHGRRSKSVGYESGDCKIAVADGGIDWSGCVGMRRYMAEGDERMPGGYDNGESTDLFLR